MKKSLVFLVALTLIFGMATISSATMVNFQFDPDDLIQRYSTIPLPVDNPSGTSHLKYQQDNPRRVHEDWGDGEKMYNTFGTTGSITDQQSQDTYIAWRNSLDTPDEGIAWFNIWLRDNTNAWNWGERLVSNPDVKPIGTAASGWQVAVDANPWGSGWLVEWWTDETDNLINLVNDLDPFGFGVDVREISASGQTYADGTDIALGSTWDIWFGSYGGIYNDDEPYKSWNYYETGAPIGGWEGTLELAAVPEPATMLLLGSGLIGLAGLGRKKFFKKS